MRNGAVVLPIILIIAAIIGGLAFTGLLLARVLNQSNFGIRLATRAEVAAEAAINDAFLRLVRGDLAASAVSDCGSGNIFDANFFLNLLDINGVNAEIFVCKEGIGYKMGAEASYLLVKRRLSAVVNGNENGELNLISIEKEEFD